MQRLQAASARSRWREPLGIAPLREEPLQKIDALAQFAHLLPDTSELIDLAPELLQLGRGVDVFGARLLTRDACRQGLADGRNRQEEQRSEERRVGKGGRARVRRG